MLVRVIDPSRNFDAHLLPWQHPFDSAADSPDAVADDAATFRQAIEAFRASTGCASTLATKRKLRWLGLLGSYDALTDVDATIIDATLEVGGRQAWSATLLTVHGGELLKLRMTTELPQFASPRQLLLAIAQASLDRR